MTASMTAPSSEAAGPAPVDVFYIPAISRDESSVLATTEYARFTDLVRQLGPDEFTLPTDCPEWDVRTMIVHQCGAGEGHARWTAFFRQMIGGLRLVKGREIVDGLNDFHLRERADWTAERAVAALPAIQARAVKGRRDFPGLLRHIPVSSPGAKGFSMGFLFDIILTRDTWMHRVDIARTTGRTMVLTPEHDGRVIADVVADWARQHGQPFLLNLTGPAGGVYRQGSGSPQLTLDAVEFCRTISGREQGTGLLAQHVVW
ncbi:MAG: maleylpyruvate isomerase family mycothiol-dependent enzyme [Candidatus Dormibacteria bacterium]